MQPPPAQVSKRLSLALAFKMPPSQLGPRIIAVKPTLRVSRRCVLIIGGSFSGLAAGRDLGSHYLVTIIDAKDSTQIRIK